MPHDVIETLGWTLLHFMWQGIAAAVLLTALLLMLRRATAQTKYLVTCGVFATMAVAPLATSAWLATHSRNHRTTPVVAVIETPQEIMTVVSGTPMERSTAQAFAQLILWMEADFGWNRWRAYDLLTHVAQISVGYYAIGTIAAKVAKRYLGQAG